MSMRLAAFLTIATGFLVAMGCTSGKPTAVLSGEVVYDGQPLEKGMILFESADHSQAPLSVEIKAGKYQVAADRELVPGRYIVRITAPDLSKPKPTGLPDQITYPPLLPPQWNTKSELSAELTAGRQSIVFRGDKGSPPKIETAAK